MLLKPHGCDLTPCVVKSKGIVLSVTNASKYLGVWINDELTWKSHIDHLSRKCALASGRLWRHGRCLTIRARKTWYISIPCHPCCMPPTVFHPACLVWKKWLYPAFELSSVSNTTLQLHLSETVSMLSLLLSCIGRKLYFLYSVVLRAFQAHSFLHFLLSSKIISSIPQAAAKWPGRCKFPSSVVRLGGNQFNL